MKHCPQTSIRWHDNLGHPTSSHKQFLRLIRSRPRQTTNADMDCVFLRNLRFELSVGPDAWHRHGKTQPVFVSIRLDQSDTAANVDYDTSIIKAAASDDVSKCLDYGKLYKTISAVLTSGDGQFASIRHVAQAVLQCVPHLGTGTARGYKIEVSLPKSSLRAHGGLQYVEEADVVNTSMVYRQTLWISSIQCACILGVNPHERLERQPVIVNLRFQSEDNNCGRASAEATTSSVLAATDQFQEITNAVVKVSRAKHFKLTHGMNHNATDLVFFH